MDAERIRENLRKWTSYPHLGGSPGEERLGNELRDAWIEQGLDYVTSQQYEVLLSTVDKEDPSLVFLLNGNDEVQFTSQAEEPVKTPDQNQTDIVPPFNAYSASGQATGQLVYVNYGRVEDFDQLVYNFSVDLTGTVAIARYGKIFRGDKASNAADYGCSGIIIYTDPEDYSVDGEDNVYPDSWWLPGEGVQRGTVFKYDGDPLTQGYPATDSAYRVPLEEAQLPTIPVHPIGYNDALQLMRDMGGVKAPEDWQGGMNFTYYVGPGFVEEKVDWKVRMNITTHNVMANTTNVFGYITGAVEPDRYVLLGNHRDAWVFGALDPTSGTAVMAEVSRVLMKIVQEGWRPRRTIVFCSWGAEEYALIGSVEYVEQFTKPLGERAVVNLNLDMAFEGNASLRGLGVPILYDAMYDVARKVPSANDPSKSLFEEWLVHFPSYDREEQPTGLPSVGQLGAGSDYAGFITMVGIPALDVRYTYSRSKWSISGYPLYHSAYETFHLVESYIDSNFEYSKAVGIYWAEMTRYMADSLVLPFNCSRYAETLGEYVLDLEDGYGKMMSDNGIDLVSFLSDQLKRAVAGFQGASDDFHDRLDDINTNNPILVRAYNDQLMQVERAFTDPNGLPLRPAYKHLIYAPSTHDAYAGATFPGLVDLMFEIEDGNEEDWNEVKHHYAALIFVIESATLVLCPPTLMH
ncbi:hypothetical protein CAPTEDRAFT_201615 [Capitella teleta]|uniref:Glutamate carboxypeptidase 2 n=1 Tax=Capitella teleta TaxID=283909 RepID=R7V201_CAPTE|nr:hypothetical protein CAPTEDRAFT_201615 [Capitella teleta]|eukprot:ELU12569.1 hypothetical protein CAPTEDRAFT_201615 [Capitella teleta]